MKRTLKPAAMLYPLPAVLVTGGDMENSTLMTAAWTGIVNSDPPMTYVSIRPERYSYDIIRERGEFVINLTTRQLAKETDYAGCVSMRREDKFKTLGLVKEAADEVAAPLIAQCPVNLECKVVEQNGVLKTRPDLPGKCGSAGLYPRRLSAFGIEEAGHLRLFRYEAKDKEKEGSRKPAGLPDEGESEGDGPCKKEERLYRQEQAGIEGISVMRAVHCSRDHVRAMGVPPRSGPSNNGLPDKMKIQKAASGQGGFSMTQITTWRGNNLLS